MNSPWFGVAICLALVGIYQGFIYWSERKLVHRLLDQNAALMDRVQAGTLEKFDEHVERVETRERIERKRALDDEEQKARAARQVAEARRLEEQGHRAREAARALRI